MTVQRTDRFPVLSYLSRFAGHSQRWDEARTGKNRERSDLGRLDLAQWWPEEHGDHTV